MTQMGDPLFAGPPSDVAKRLWAHDTRPYFTV